MTDSTPESRHCEICGDPILPRNVHGICGNPNKPECRRALERRRRESAPRPEPRYCEICGDPVQSNNKYGICGNKKKPACLLARSRKAAPDRKKRRASRARPDRRRFCEICGKPIRSNNKYGICAGPGWTKCKRERQRRQGRSRPGVVPKYRIKISVGDRFGLWVALEDYSLDNRRVLCRCACGREIRVDGSSLVTDHTHACRSCAAKLAVRRRRPPYIPAGTAFSLLTVLEDVWHWADLTPVRCRCGTEKDVKAILLKTYRVKSCGCLKLARTHGFSNHPLFGIWSGIKQRCLNPNARAFQGYGDSGITICTRWLDPWLFAEDIYREIGPRPEDRDEKGRLVYTLDRWPDNERGYEPGNVRWADKKTQRINQRRVGKLAGQRDALAAQVEALTAQLQALTEQPPAPRRRKMPPPSEEPLF